MASGEIAKDIAGVNRASSQISVNSTQVEASAGELSRLAAQLTESVVRFKITQPINLGVFRILCHGLSFQSRLAA